MYWSKNFTNIALRFSADSWTYCSHSY